MIARRNASDGTAIKSILCFTIPLLVVRLYSLFLNFSNPLSLEIVPPVLRGFASDLAAGVVAGTVFCRLWHVSLGYAALWLSWTVLHVLNTEHVAVNTSNLDYGFANLALTGEFIGGSIFSLRALLTICVCTSLSLTLLVACLYARKRLRAERIRQVVWVFASMAMGATLVPPAQAFPNWVQMNLVEENARSFMFGGADLPQKTYTDATLPRSFFEHTLSGKAMFPLPLARLNVLIIMVEGISHDVSTTHLMPTFSRLHKEYMTYANFLSLQRQTNRGIYAVLCGDYPNFLTREAKSDLVGMFGPQRKCLPERLREHGYRTVFMQGSPLGYMRKDKFAEQSGFDEYVGSGDYDQAYGRSNWGVDDRTLYWNAHRKIKQLDEAEIPWFLALLTVTTHHPYLVPGASIASEEEAVQYADTALSEFLERLQRGGLLKNTLVLLTSDESAFVRLTGFRREGVLNELGENHAPLIVWGPEVPRARIQRGIFSQADIAVSVLDYVGIPSEGLIGRSIFRAYDNERTVVFGNVFTSKVYALAPNGALYACSKTLDCSVYMTERGNLFGAQFHRGKVDEGYLAEMRQALAANELHSGKLYTRYVFRERNREYHGSRWLLGDHKLQADTNDKITWNIRIRAEDPINVVARALLVESEESYDDVFEKMVYLEGQQEFVFTRDFYPEYDDAWIWTKVYVLAEKTARFRVLELTVERSKQ